MRPIPRALLIHSATLQQAQSDAYGKPTLTTLAKLTRVRVQPSTQTAADNEGERVEQTALLIYDALNSLPAGTAFAVGQWVTFDGVTYRVTAVELCYDGHRLHHMEIGLTGEALPSE